MKKLLLLIVICALAFPALPGPKVDKDKMESNEDVIIKAVLNGKIIDANTNEGLAGVKIQLYGSDIITYTDFDGNFKFEGLEPQACAIIINYISYYQKVVNINLSENNQAVIIKLAKL